MFALVLKGYKSLPLSYGITKDSLHSRSVQFRYLKW